MWLRVNTRSVVHTAMSSRYTSPLEDLEVDAIDNVYVYVADSVRYDSVPDRVAERGRRFKTVSAALCTPQSLPSIVTGRHAPRHGVTWFHETLEDAIPTVFDLEATTGYNEIVWEGRAVRDVLGGPPAVDLETVESPFVVFEHDNGGHSPYTGYDEYSPAEMFAELSSVEELRRLYRETIEESTDRLEQRLDVLDERGLLENTLVVYLSDHGELLCERGGFVGHGLPATPETVYVPMVFVHDSLSPGDGETLVRHTDLLPTIDAVISDGKTTVDADGTSLLGDVEPERPTFTQGLMRPPAKYRGTSLDPNYDASSIWTSDGGYVFNDTLRHVRPLTAIYDALRSGYTGAFDSGPSTPRKLVAAFDQYLRSVKTYGEPGISRSDARERIDRLSTVSVETSSHSLDEETKEHLAQLGYR